MIAARLWEPADRSDESIGECLGCAYPWLSGLSRTKTRRSRARRLHDHLEKVNERIVAEVPGVNRVALGITTRRPDTIERE